MAHKVHPKSYRLKELSDWSSRWLDVKNFSRYLEEDFIIREFFQERIGKLGVEKIDIERFPGKLNIIIFSARPGLIIGRAGSGVEKFKRELESKFLNNHQAKKELKIEIREAGDVWASSSLVAQQIAQQIEKRVPFRKVLKQALSRVVSSRQVKGARIEVSGRLNGVEIARREWQQKGSLPRQTIRANIDFTKKEAYCTYGTIGIKVWIYKGEKFE